MSLITSEEFYAQNRIENGEIPQILNLLRVKPSFYPERIMVCNWFAITFSMALFHVSYSNVFKIFKACFLKKRLAPFQNVS